MTELNFQFDKTWSLQPIDGETGQTFMGMKDSQKVFIKRNTTPFLAALSREGIVPKLVWTKRLGDGNVLTAQEWLEGETLTPTEMSELPAVIQLLHDIHHSRSLKNMLYRLGGEEMTAFAFLSQYSTDLPAELRHNPYLHRVFRYLEDHLPNDGDIQVCHGDPIHSNWFLSEENRLYLVDWDATVLADPALDLGIILGRYVPYNQWRKWLEFYGYHVTEEVLERVYWYSGMDFLRRIKHYYEQFELQKMNREILLLQKIFNF